MGLRLEIRRYRLPLRVPVRTAHEVWQEREGLLLRLSDESGRHGWGEIAPIPAFGTETLAEAEAAGEKLGEAPAAADLQGIPARLRCVRSAIAMAQSELARSPDAGPADGDDVIGTDPKESRTIAALLPAGRAAIGQIPSKAEMGFRVFKWKVGVSAVDDELVLLDDVCAALPGGAKLRLDANGAWDRRQAERWLARCAERPIEFVEQPCFAPASLPESVRRRTDDILLGLAADYPTPIALDESLVGEGDVERWLAAGWPGCFVVKPSLLGDVDRAIERLQAAKANVVFSSALETALGARAALRFAFAWRGDRKALGFGVWPLFQDPRFDGPAAVPFLRWSDVRKIDPESIWNALS